TYIYDNEADYYKGYQDSCFGVTMKKAGWDCMRHYEILANGCLPLFLDVHKIPPAVMTHLPKMQMLWTYEYLASEQTKGATVPNDEYLAQLHAALNILRTQCTTQAIAASLLHRF